MQVVLSRRASLLPLPRTASSSYFELVRSHQRSLLVTPPSSSSSTFSSPSPPILLRSRFSRSTSASIIITAATAATFATMSHTAEHSAPDNPNQNPPASTIINPLPRSLYPAQITFVPSEFLRADESPDSRFYVSPRFVQHIDDGAIASLKAYYAAALVMPKGPGADADAARVVDLCASWTSHLHDGVEVYGGEREEKEAGLRGGGSGGESRLRLASCVGYGLNEKEMRANKHLTGFWVRDFNDKQAEGGLSVLREIGDATIDAVICSVSVDYLIRPLEVIAEVRRCLKNGGTVHMAFSNRCFPTKVISRWLKMRDEERRKWVGSYFWAVGGFEDVEEVILKDGRDGNDPLFVVRARKGPVTAA